MKRGRRLATFAALVAAVAGLAREAEGERLPARKYTTADGLINDYIVQIYCDSRGFVWFSTRDGLSRFDGVRFITYGMSDGLPAGAINGVFETRTGAYWIATNGGGLYRFNPRGRRPTAAAPGRIRPSASTSSADPLFTPFRVGPDPATNRVNAIVEDSAGDLWIGTDGGLFRMRSTGQPVTFERWDLSARGDFGLPSVSSLIEDAEGSLWIGGSWGLSRRLPDGRLVRYAIEPADSRAIVDALVLGSQRDLWVGYRSGLMVLDTRPPSTFTTPGPIVRTLPGAGVRLPQSDDGSTAAAERARWFTVADGLPDRLVTALFRENNGSIWVGTNRGAAVYDGHALRSYTTANGLADNYLTSMAGDRAGNVWLGSVGGVTRVIPHGLITYDETDGLPRARIHWLGQGLSGDVFVVSGDYMVSQFDGKRFRTVRPQLPGDARCTWTSPCGFLDHAGEWWLPTTVGLYRYPRIAGIGDLLNQPPRAVYTKATGLPTDSAFKVYEDRRGDVWIATAPDGLAQWQRSTAAWKAYTEADGMPPATGTASLASAFGEDRAGNVWIGFYDGGLGRIRNGRVELFGIEDGAPVGLVTALHRDAAGRLWIATNQAGLTRLDDAEADQPTFTTLTANAHLASINVRCVIEDDRGRIYAGTSRGIDRLDPVTGRVEHFGAGEGLASEFVSTAFRDGRGGLWFGTMSGLSRLDGSAVESFARETAPSPVLISELRVRGEPQPVSELGDSAPGQLTLSPDQNQLEIGFFSLALRAGELVKYQYRIESLDAEWSAPIEVQHVNYGRLPAGSHRFLVRSVRPDGAVSEPAVVAFTVLPPLYARWWFISALVLVAGAGAFTLYRIRIAQLLRVEKVRARIATDLHDDIGASLSQIAILAEVAQAQKPAEKDPAGPLARIAETSRGLVDSMSDIVWAINPEVDSLSDLIHRMRRFAEDTLGAADIALRFPEPVLRQDPRLGPEMRREIFLILKESVTNIAKHSSCRHVSIELDSDRRRLQLRITDDGRGFDPEQPTDGNGLSNMRRRVATLGGQLTIQSRFGAGTTTTLEVHL